MINRCVGVLWALSTICLVSWCAAQEKSGEQVVKASSFGFDPVDSTRALQAAIHSGAAKVIVDLQQGPWIVEPITLASNQEILFEKGVEVLAKKGSFKGKSDPLFRAARKENITLTGYGATLRMRRADYDGPEYTKAEWRHVLSFLSCTNVRVYGLTLTESGGDGIYLGTGAPGVPNKNIHIRDVVCDKNYRQGISVISAEDLLIERCVLSNTAGTAPAAGIDFEPNLPGERLVRCTMRDCVSQNNAGGGYHMYLPTLWGSSAPVSLVFERCKSIGDQHMAISLQTGNTPKKAVSGSVEWTDCVFQDCPGPGVRVVDKPTTGCRLRLVRCSLVNVATGPRERAPIAMYTHADGTQPMGGIELVDCRIREPGNRNPIVMSDAAGNGLLDVRGNLKLETDRQIRDVTLSEKVLAEWIPALAIKKIPRLSLAGQEMKPAGTSVAAKPDALAFARFRGTVHLAFWAAQGDDVRIRMHHRQFAKYDGTAAPLAILSPQGVLLERVKLPFQQETEIPLRAPATGLYRITAEMGTNLLQVVSSSQPMMVVGDDSAAHLIATAGEFYFWVPAGTAQFGVRVCGEGQGEGVKAALVNPQGKVVEECDDAAQVHQFEVNLPGASSGEAWSVRLARPTKLAFEDHFVDLRGLPPLLAGSRDALVKPER